MNVTGVFIDRPVTSVLVALAILLCGLLALRQLPVAPLPQVDYPSIQVQARMPGASPESMAATVATPLERALGTIAGVTDINSTSIQGQTSINLRFDLDRNVDEAAREVQAAINAARSQLPSGMPGMPSYRKVNPTQAPIMALALSSATLSPGEVFDTASTVIAQKISQIPGVGSVEVGGSSLPAVRVSLDPNALNHHGIALDEVANAIRSANTQRPLGSVSDDRRSWQVEGSLQLRRAEEYRPLIIAWRDGRPVRLSDVATVSEGVENRYASGFHNDRDAVILTVSRQPQANIIETVDAIHAQMDMLQALLPPGVDMKVAMDRSPVIRATLREAEFTLIAAVALVVMVVLGFLGNWRAALLPTLSIPVVLFGALAIIWLGGFSLNNLSLTALIVAAILVVDDAIVVLENISRHIENGVPPLQAARRGAAEVSATLLSMNIALAVVFVAILFLDDFVERLFREFSLTLVAAMAVSLLICLSLTPALSARVLRPEAPARDSGNRFKRFFAGFFDDLRSAYVHSLDNVLRRAWIPVLVFVGVVGLNVWLFNVVPKGSVPRQDTGQLRGFARGDDGLSFQAMAPKILAYRKLLMEDPAIEDIIGYSGGGTGVNNAWIMIKVKPLAERRVSSQQIIDRIREKTPSMPGAALRLFVDQDIQIQGGSGEGSYEMEFLSDDLRLLRQWAPRAGEALRKLPELTDVETSGDEGMRQVVLDIDREAAGRLGIDMRTVASVLNNSFSQRQVATLYDNLNQYRVVMELDPRYTESPSTLEQVYAIGNDGQRVPLAAFTRFSYGMAPDRLQHRGQFASVRTDFSLAPGVSLEQATAAIDQAMARIMLPTGVQARLQGEAAAFEDMKKNQLWLILGAALAVYLVLGMLYESFAQPLTILSTLPSAGVGALLALILMDDELNLISLLGLFLLVGVVMKNTILLVDFALDAERTRGLRPRAAILEAARLRFRPIIMTSVAALLGMLPLMLALGEGWEMRRPLGIAIVGGLLVSQVLTLYTTPAVYLAVSRARRRVLERRQGNQLATGTDSGRQLPDQDATTTPR